MFGGDASGDGRPARDSTARVYDIDEGEWTVEECAARPQAGLGHARSLRDSEGQACVAALGGLRGRDDAITTTCDALQKRLKIGAVPKGEAPKPHVHGCAVVLRNGAKAVVWTGRPLSKGDKDTPSNARWCGAGAWQRADCGPWTRMQFVMGDKPSFRSKAACCLLPDGISVLVHGGLDEDTSSMKMIDGEFILDTRRNTSRAPRALEQVLRRAGRPLG